MSQERAIIPSGRADRAVVFCNKVLLLLEL
jgi:hypothetical protein